MTRRAGIARFYPIVPDVTWLNRIVPLGVRTVQLRMKDTPEVAIAGEIASALALTRRHGCQLIINDFWRQALDAGADYVHLGQEDLRSADIGALKRAGVRLGISTHDENELDTALSVEPDYVALGPIYETKLKVMPWPPQGLSRIKVWKGRIGALPLVAIGGLTPERAGGTFAAGADSIAVITDFVTASDPEARVRTWLDVTS